MRKPRLEGSPSSTGRALNIETLEPRQLLMAAPVLDDPDAAFIRLRNGEQIPNYVQNPTVVSVADGDWSDPSTWSTANIPGDNDVVRVEHAVRYDVEAPQAELDSLGISPGGTLDFRTDVDTSLWVGTLIVFSGGTLEVGTVDDPVAADVSAEIVIRDVALDVGVVGPGGEVLAEGFDPEQYGVGLLGFGTIAMHGAPMSETFVRAADDIIAGTSILTLETAVTDWSVGDTLFVPDTRQVSGEMARELDKQYNQFDDSDDVPTLEGWEPHWEEVTIESIKGTVVTIVGTFQYDHLGQTDGEGNRHLPHVAPIERNVVVRSEDPHGTRGHVLVNDRAAIDIRYARFQDLGRTDAFRPLDRTQFDTDGNVEHIGTNQLARYTFHFHHVIGPENPTPEDPTFDVDQYTLIGNTFDGGRKWGLVVHGTSYGLIEDNFIYDIDGAGFVAENGEETHNRIVHNFAARIQGTGVDGAVKPSTTTPDIQDYGKGGTGFWFRSTGNEVRDNVAANTSLDGFRYRGGYLNNVPVPNYPGAFRHSSDPAEATRINTFDVGVHDGNEVYGYSRNGFYAVFTRSPERTPDDPAFAITNTTVWNVYGIGINVDESTNVDVLGARVWGDSSAVSDNGYGSIGIKYREVENLRIENSYVGGLRTGILTHEKHEKLVAGTVPVSLNDLVLENLYNIEVAANYGVEGKAVAAEHVVMRPLAGGPVGLTSYDFALSGDPNAAGLLLENHVVVTSLNGGNDADYQVYSDQQRVDVQIASTADFAELSALSLTNREMWSRYGRAAGGAIAPAIVDTSGDILNASDEIAVAGGFAMRRFAHGPFVADFGDAVVLDASGIVSTSGSLTYEWDLNLGWTEQDGSALFQSIEATGISPTISAAQAAAWWPAYDFANPDETGVFPIGVRIKDSSGNTLAEAWTTIVVRRPQAFFDPAHSLLYVSGDMTSNQIIVESRMAAAPKEQFVVVRIDGIEVMNESTPVRVPTAQIQRLQVAGFEGGDFILADGVDAGSGFNIVDTVRPALELFPEDSFAGVPIRHDFGVLLMGHDGGNVIVGSHFSDRIIGGAGIDWIDGGFGGDGYDWLSGEEGSDVYSFHGLYAGADVILETDFGGRGDDGTLSDRDTINFSNYESYVGTPSLPLDLRKISGPPYRRISGAEFDPRLSLRLARPNRTLNGIYTGIESVIGSPFNDVIIGTNAANLLVGGGGGDWLMGKGGDDAIVGGEGNDLLDGETGDDVLLGQAGNDRLEGRQGDDLLYGNSGNDTIFGDMGDDAAYGGDGDDVISGGDADDLIDAGAGDDNVGGGDGADLIIGGIGADLLDGDAGEDFVIASTFFGDADLINAVHLAWRFDLPYATRAALGTALVQYGFIGSDTDTDRIFGGEGLDLILLQLSDDDLRDLEASELAVDV